ncbi:formylglycine-generating enzyme family protein [Lentibacter algarum]|uniref:formylglycine-generating enzyme family protein n=1 Tax=Lentibacter algarum TaxID=576131 RepID=UPI001C0713C0|nr:formylglycine-generating enzyme family protein [Lentibacter algarum]MBU2981926.1 formylglycine-generating enzyme family protein [Lentibacter algarum]
MIEKRGSSCCAPARDDSLKLPKPQHKADSNTIAPLSEADDIVSIPAARAFVGTDKPVLTVDGEAPLRRQAVKAFRMDVTTVTNARFARFVEATGYITEAEHLGDSFVFAHQLPDDAPPTRGVVETPWWRVIEGAYWREPIGPDSSYLPDHPVVHITWSDARAFAKWAGGRLPTEAEWEHAARGGQGDVRFPWGDDEPDDTANFPCNIWQGRFPQQNLAADGYAATAPAKSFAPNGYGLYNMVGNVWEWTAQPFRVRSLKKTTQAAHAHKGAYKLTKGGSFLCHASYCYRYRIAARNGSAPDSSTTHQGFRLVYPA